MKLLVLISCVTFLAIAQTTIPHGDFDATADQQARDGAVIRLSGHVVIETDALQLRADTADFNTNSKEIVAHGDVRVQLK
jgi:lipopolysaccharide assembly outer membrane protein LptD (OstA)